MPILWTRTRRSWHVLTYFFKCLNKITSAVALLDMYKLNTWLCFVLIWQANRLYSLMHLCCILLTLACIIHTLHVLYMYFCINKHFNSILWLLLYTCEQHSPFIYLRITIIVHGHKDLCLKELHHVKTICYDLQIRCASGTCTYISCRSKNLHWASTLN